MANHVILGTCYTYFIQFSTECLQSVLYNAVLMRVGIKRAGVGLTIILQLDLKWVIEHCPEPIVESVLNFCHYTLNDDALTDYLDFFEQHGIGVVNASPLSMGLLSQRGVPAWHPAPKALVEACQRAAAHCADKGYPIERLAVQYAVSNPRIASTLFSSANPENVRRNIQWANEEPDWQLVQEVKDIIGNQQRVTWANS